MALALFDLDNTLLGDDSDHLWGEFLVQNELVPSAEFKQRNDLFYNDYIAGNLDVFAYLEFVLGPIAERTEAELAELHSRFMADYIEPIILPASIKLIEKHRQAGDTLVIITATNDFITTPIAERLGIETLICSRGEKTGGRYTGKITGTPCFREGKITNLNQWLASHPNDLSQAFFYSDSHNDLPLLAAVGQPVAVDPDDTLRAHALKTGWPIISLRK